MSFGRTLRSSIAALLVAGVTLLGSEACVTFSNDEKNPDKGSPARAASVRVAVYETRSTAKKAAVFAGTVRSKLVRLEPLPAETVFESADASWSFADLPPGKYRLEISQRAGPEPGSPEVRRGEEAFKVKAGEEVAARVILHDSRGFLLAGVSIGAAVGIGIVVVAAFRSTFKIGLSNTARSAPSDNRQ